MSTSPQTMRGRAKDALLEAAGISLAEHGSSGTTARVICDISGANLRSIAYHYGSVRELLLAALSTNFRTWMAPLIEAVTDRRSEPQRSLERGLTLFASELPDRAGIVAAWLEAVALSRHDPELRQRLAENQRGFKEALTRTLSEACAHQPAALAATLITLCDGLMIRYLLQGEAPHPLSLARQLAHQTHTFETSRCRALDEAQRQM